ncbi:hypothetical protein AB0I10_38995 [Streptomyces sp. NPDC050636]|uniref:hypothetical protein n=1 Tax=Streptomyces sp. NPDC050636 TaxID=3154510 RepID=UPI0034160DD7
MRERDRATASASAIAWAGAAAFVVCLLARKVAPYPRWDLLACLVVSAGAVLVWWLRASGRLAPAGRAAPEPARSVAAGRRTRWWPERRLELVLLALTALPLPLVMLLLSTTANTPQVDAILAHHPRISQVTIAQVHHSYLKDGRNYRYYESAVTVTLAATGRSGKGAPRPKGTVQTSQPPHPGDRFLGLYAADDPTAGVILDSRAELRALLDGRAGPGDLAMLALYSLFPLGAAVAALRPRAAPLASDGVFGDGDTRMLRVRLVGAGAGDRLRRPVSASKQAGPLLSPALRLASSSGDRDLLLERCLDPVPLAEALKGSWGRLYWTPRAEDRPEWSTPALLVLDDGRYVRGATTRGTPPEAPAGEAVSGPLPDVETSRPVGPYALWQPHVHRPGVICFGIAFLAVVLLVSGVGYDGGMLGTALPLVAAAGPTVGVMLIGRRRTCYLRQLVQQT